VAETTVILDCTVFAQALINPHGPAGAVVSAAQRNEIVVVVSDHVLAEVRALAAKLPEWLELTPERMDAYILDLLKYVRFLEDVPTLFVYPRDPDDAPYVNLGIAAHAEYLVTRDRDLLDLMESDSFRRQFPTLKIVTPNVMLASLREP
jgi:putative PIN family toxin of toxin-antitoxin system